MQTLLGNDLKKVDKNLKDGAVMVTAVKSYAKNNTQNFINENQELSQSGLSAQSQEVIARAQLTYAALDKLTDNVQKLVVQAATAKKDKYGVTTMDTGLDLEARAQISLDRMIEVVQAEKTTLEQKKRKKNPKFQAPPSNEELENKLNIENPPKVKPKPKEPLSKGGQWSETAQKEFEDSLKKNATHKSDERSKKSTEHVPDPTEHSQVHDVYLPPEAASADYQKLSNSRKDHDYTALHKSLNHEYEKIDDYEYEEIDDYEVMQKQSESPYQNTDISGQFQQFPDLIANNYKNPSTKRDSVYSSARSSVSDNGDYEDISGRQGQFDEQEALTNISDILSKLETDLENGNSEKSQTLSHSDSLKRSRSNSKSQEPKR